MSRTSSLHGARILCYVNGRLFGRITDFNWTSATPRKKIHTIDIPHPVELASTTADVTWTMTVIRTVGDGGAQGMGMTTTAPLLSREKYFTILLLDRGTDLTLFRADLCMTDSESWNVAAKSLIIGQIAGSGIVWLNEAAQ
jgi:hypothetical protein